MPEPGLAFLATGLVVSSYWVVAVALHSWSCLGASERTALPAVITAVAIGVAFLLALLLPVPPSWSAIAVFVGPLVAAFYLRRGIVDPRRRLGMRIGLAVAFVATLAALFVLDSANLLL
jgi:hypothetical protein